MEIGTDGGRANSKNGNFLIEKIPDREFTKLFWLK